MLRRRSRSIARRGSEAQAFEPRLDLAKCVDLNLLSGHVAERGRVAQEPANGDGTECGFVREPASDAPEALERHGIVQQRSAGIGKCVWPALERALNCGGPAVVNVVVDPYARATTQAFGSYSSKLS